MQNPFLIWPLVCVALLGLTGCGSKVEREAVAEAQTLLKHREYSKAVSTINEALKEKPSSKALLRERIVAFLWAERPDLAYAAYQDLVSRVSKKDDVLADALAHPEPIVRASAAKTLASVRDSDSRSALEKASGDKEEMVRRAAVNALGHLRDPKSVKALQKALQDASWFVRGEAARALGAVADARSAEALFAALEDSDEYVRHTAGTALVDLAKPETQAIFLKEVAQSRGERQIVSALALANIGQKEGVAVIEVEMARASDPLQRRRCLEALAKLRLPACLPAIQARLADPDGSVQFAAVTTLSMIPHESSIALLKRKSEDLSAPEIVRARARDAALIITKELASKPTSRAK